MMNIEHPDITEMRKTGYPRGYVEPEPVRCPVCGREVEQYIFQDRDGEVFGCDQCVESVDVY